MKNLLLFRVLTPTDFNGMTGRAKIARTGGGAMHISLGRDTPEFQIRKFLNVEKGHAITVKTKPYIGRFASAKLTFDGNPKRRNGEWRVTNQFSHRHPAWQSQEGFPNDYVKSNRPIILLARINDDFHARYVMESQLVDLPPTLQDFLSGSREKGITDLKSDWAVALQVLPLNSTLIHADIEARRVIAANEDDFLPQDENDARARVLREIVQRQGQPRFRRKLLKAYGHTCAISGCAISEVLEAAHITPYLGPQTNHLRNGLLLRADIHTLFDLDLLAIDPETARVRVSSLVVDPDYRALHGTEARLPTDPTARPSLAALRRHYVRFQE